MQADHQQKMKLTALDNLEANMFAVATKKEVSGKLMTRRRVVGTKRRNGLQEIKVGIGWYLMKAKIP
jgi:hypothetical protein